MSSILAVCKSRIRPTAACNTRCFSRTSSSRRKVQAGDIVLLRPKADDRKHAAPILTLKLDPTGPPLLSHHGKFKQSDIVGKQIRDTVETSTGFRYRIHDPTMDEFIRYMPRLVTPIYPADAHLIVSLLDLHPDPRTGDRIEIFEAGTGHGSLTIHMARAIHACNAVPFVSEDDTPDMNPRPAVRHGQQAIIHTLDRSAQHSAHAQRVIQDYRNALYTPNIQFHHGEIIPYLESRLAAASSQNPTFTHAVVDVPAAHQYLAKLGECLETNAPLILFCPSIIEVTKCVRVIEEQNLPFLMDATVECGPAAGVGGREWDMKMVRPRRSDKKNIVTFKNAGAEHVNETGTTTPIGDEAPRTEDEKHPDLSPEPAFPTLTPDARRPTRTTVAEQEEVEWEMVCRPKVGGKVAGGGFLAVMRKMASVRPE